MPFRCRIVTHKKLQLIYKHLFFYAQNYQETYFTLLWMLSLKNEIYWAVDIGHLKEVLENFNPSELNTFQLFIIQYLLIVVKLSNIQSIL